MAKALFEEFTLQRIFDDFEYATIQTTTHLDELERDFRWENICSKSTRYSIQRLDNTIHAKKSVPPFIIQKHVDGERPYWPFPKTTIVVDIHGIISTMVVAESPYIEGREYNHPFVYVNSLRGKICLGKHTTDESDGMTVGKYYDISSKEKRKRLITGIVGLLDRAEAILLHGYKGKPLENFTPVRRIENCGIKSMDTLGMYAFLRKNIPNLGVCNNEVKR